MKTRIISAIIMIAIIVPTLLFANKYLFAAVIIIVGLEAAREMVKTKKQITFYSAIIMYISVIAAIIFSVQFGFVDNTMLAIIFVAHGLAPIISKNLSKNDFTDTGSIFMMNMYLVLGFSALTFFQVHFDWKHLFYPIIIAVSCDTFGYFGGMLFGKKKLVEPISPSKTIEGAISATTVTLIISVVYLFKLTDFSVVEIVLVSFVMTVLSQCGDLFASVIKRTFEIKDYANIIPGHGGVLDRVDSTLFNFIVFAIIVNII